MKSKLTSYQKELKQINTKLNSLIESMGEYTNKPIKEFESYLASVRSLEYKRCALTKNIEELQWEK
jgi:hypothetical protein